MSFLNEISRVGIWLFGILFLVWLVVRILGLFGVSFNRKAAP